MNAAAAVAYTAAMDLQFLGATDTVTDQGSEMLHHPALKRIPRIRVPEAWTVCGSPDYTRAARAIVAQLAAIDRGGQ